MVIHRQWFSTNPGKYPSWARQQMRWHRCCLPFSLYPFFALSHGYVVVSRNLPIFGFVCALQVLIVSDAFDTLSMLDRQRLVHMALKAPALQDRGSFRVVDRQSRTDLKCDLKWCGYASNFFRWSRVNTNKMCVSIHSRSVSHRHMQCSLSCELVWFWTDV